METSVDGRARVLIVGAGPAGIGVAIGLARRRLHGVLLLERADRPGGIPARYRGKQGHAPTYVTYTGARVIHGEQFADLLIDKLSRTDTEVRLECCVVELDRAQRIATTVDPRAGMQRIQAEAIVVATGAREATITERGWIDGDRRARGFHTMQLLELIARGKMTHLVHPVVLGSDVLAYAVAAKLRCTGSGTVTLIDSADSPRARLWERAFFHRWVRPRWHGADRVTLTWDGNLGQSAMLPDGRSIPNDAVMVSGELVPNHELLVAAGLATRSPARSCSADRRGRLEVPGWFAVGNVRGGALGGQACYFQGKRLAATVAGYLESLGRSPGA